MGITIIYIGNLSQEARQHQNAFYNRKKNTKELCYFKEITLSVLLAWYSADRLSQNQSQKICHSNNTELRGTGN